MEVLVEEQSKAKYQIEDLSFSSLQPEKQVEDNQEADLLKDPFVQFVSDMAEAEVLDVPDETLDLIKDSVLDGNFEFSKDYSELAEEILKDQSSGNPF